jgi:uncharacterized protein (DUF302 family)
MTPEGVVTKSSAYTVGETVARLTDLIEARGLTLFAVIDHSGEALRVGLQLPDTKLLIFGDPAAGTPVMAFAPLAALDLPLKVLVAEGPGGAVSVSYNGPAFIAARYGLTDDLRARLEGIGPLTDAVHAA